MSDILGIIGRSLLPEISTEQSSDILTGDSGFDLTQLDSPNAMAWPIPTAIPATAIPTDPLAQWLEQTLGISSHFSAPETDAMPELDGPFFTAPPFVMAEDDGMSDMVQIAITPQVEAPLDTPAAPPEQHAPDIDEDGLPQPAVPAHVIADILTVQPLVTAPLDRMRVAAQVQPVRIEANTDKAVTDVLVVATPSTQSAPLITATAPTPAGLDLPEQATPVVAAQQKTDTQTDVADQVVAPVKTDQGTVQKTTIPAYFDAEIHSAADSDQALVVEQPATAEKPSDNTTKQTFAQPGRTETVPTQPTAMPDTTARPDIPSGLQITRDIATAIPVQHAPMPHTDPRQIMQQVTSAMVTTREAVS
jgi:hypothetical protein